MAPTFHGGRRYSPDIRDRGYLMRRRLGAPGEALPTRKTWHLNPRSLDQGRTGTCVGHGWENFLRCAPMQTLKRAPNPFDIYRAAVLLDEWTGNDGEATLPDGDPGLESGTSVRAGAEAVTAKGRLKTYLWAFTLQPALEFVLTQGPVVLGVNWYNTFMNPDDEGIVSIKPTSTVVGGHCFLWRGADTARGLAVCENSWGDDWGINGKFYIPLRDLDRLIAAEQGEACSAIEQKLASKVVMPPATKSV